MVHIFENNGVRLALDVHSGSVHELDEQAYEVLRLSPGSFGSPGGFGSPDALQKPADPLLHEAYDELCELQQQGLLSSADDYGTLADKLGLAPLKALCLHVSHDCNLRCAYCFAGEGAYGGEKQIMSPETAKAAVDFLVNQSGGRKQLEIDFFGGEPLLNWDVVTDTVAYAREAYPDKLFRFTMTTNGILLDDDKINYLNREMHNVVLSLDGRQEVNDCVRGVGVHEAVVPLFQRLVQTRGNKEWFVRGTFTKYNLDFAEDVKHLAALGLDRVSVEPVVADPSEPYALREADLSRIFEEYDRLALWLLEHPEIRFFHFMLDLAQGPCAVKRLRGCGCGNEYA
ncbi:MAG: thioether cross-link-forming SCIFF peptide maturase, partial [Oscillospiraceae bacterium]|nr:thioether cross-link-forming SCIFF peptide maturase [Oscillospiraceae bacterium]